MAAKKELFWLGVGVICIDGKDYGAGTPLPVDKIDKDNLKKMKKDGRIGGMIAPVVADGRDNRIAELESELAEMVTGSKKTIASLTADLEKATDESGECDDCEGKDKEIETLKNQVNELDLEVKKLTGELAEATKPAEEAK